MPAFVANTTARYRVRLEGSGKVLGIKSRNLVTEEEHHQLLLARTVTAAATATNRGCPAGTSTVVASELASLHRKSPLDSMGEEKGTVRVLVPGRANTKPPHHLPSLGNNNNKKNRVKKGGRDSEKVRRLIQPRPLPIQYPLPGIGVEVGRPRASPTNTKRNMVAPAPSSSNPTTGTANSQAKENSLGGLKIPMKGGTGAVSSMHGRRRGCCCCCGKLSCAIPTLHQVWLIVVAMAVYFEQKSLCGCLVSSCPCVVQHRNQPGNQKRAEANRQSQKTQQGKGSAVHCHGSGSGSDSPRRMVAFKPMTIPTKTMARHDNYDDARDQDRDQHGGC